MEKIEQKVEFSTPWFQLISKRVGSNPAPYYSLRISDYVCVIALTPAKEVSLVRQFRPAVERFTLELPSGHVEKNEDPAASARRELAEECGLDAPKMEHLGTLLSDTGRNENRVWCFRADNVTVIPGFVREPEVEPILVPASSLPGMIERGEFDFSLHVAAFCLANLKRGAGLVL